MRGEAGRVVLVTGVMKGGVVGVVVGGMVIMALGNVTSENGWMGLETGWTISWVA